jgi:hypothetical protein
VHNVGERVVKQAADSMETKREEVDETPKVSCLIELWTPAGSIP